MKVAAPFAPAVHACIQLLNLALFLSGSSSLTPLRRFLASGRSHRRKDAFPCRGIQLDLMSVRFQQKRQLHLRFIFKPSSSFLSDKMHTWYILCWYVCI